MPSATGTFGSGSGGEVFFFGEGGGVGFFGEGGGGGFLVFGFFFSFCGFVGWRGVSDSGMEVFTGTVCTFFLLLRVYIFSSSSSSSSLSP